MSNTDPRTFDLFWLQLNQIGSLCTYHHAQIDSAAKTGTPFNIIQQCITIRANLSINSPNSILLLTDMYREGRAQFSLTSQFIEVVREAGVSIPFENIFRYLPRFCREDTNTW